MAHILVATTGSNTAPYDTWAKAANKYSTALAAAVGGDTVWVASSTAETLDTTYTSAGTAANPVFVYATADTTNVPPQSVTTGVMIDASATALADIVHTGSCSVYGLHFKAGTGTSNGIISLANTDDSVVELASCTVELAGTGGASEIRLGFGGSSNIKLTTRNCTFLFGATTHGIGSRQMKWESYGDSFAPTGAVPANLIETTSVSGGLWRFEGANLSTISGNFFGTSTAQALRIELYGPKLHATFVPMVAQTNEAHVEIFIFDGDSGDVHYKLYHENAKGKTEISTAIYATAGATFDGSTHYSFKITTTADANFGLPYCSPWIEAYNEDITTSITPRLEALRDGSATKYNDDQVWGEWSYKGFTGFSRVTHVNDRRGLAASAAAQATSTLGAGDWTGEGGTAAFMKFEPAAFTPAEIGAVRARVVVAVPSSTVYVDPQIYGLAA